MTVDMMGAAASDSCSLDFPTMMDFGLETRKIPSPLGDLITATETKLRYWVIEFLPQYLR